MAEKKGRADALDERLEGLRARMVAMEGLPLMQRPTEAMAILDELIGIVQEVGAIAIGGR